MYQIGVDVLPEYRRKGIAAAVTSRLAAETMKLGKVPFYCAAWSISNPCETHYDADSDPRGLN